jgi:hypothetical protein
VDAPLFDLATRTLGGASRRQALRTLAGLALSGAVAGFTAVPIHAAEQDRPSIGSYGDDVSAEDGNKSKKKKQRKEKRCKQQASKCGVDVAGWCGTFWLDYESCRASLGSCCAQIRNCKYSAGNSCIQNNPYYFLV